MTRGNSPICLPVQTRFVHLNNGQQKQEDGEEGEFGGKNREKTDHKLCEHGVRWPRRIKFTFSFTTNKSSSQNLKTKRKERVLFARHGSRSPCYRCSRKTHPAFLQPTGSPRPLTIRRPAIGSCISRSRRPGGRAACPCGLWPVSVSAPPSGLATPSARPGRGHSDTPLLRGRPCSSGTCQRKEHHQRGSPTGAGF